jgi:tetratricopeptide (TPR) repeat protein
MIPANVDVSPLSFEQRIMRKIAVTPAVLTLLLLILSPARAGVYNPLERIEGPQPGPDGVKPLPFRQFRDYVLPDLLQLGIERPVSEGRKKCLARAEELRAKLRAGTITADERVALGEYLIRLRRPEEAVEVLMPAAVQDRRNFMAFANLASAHQLAGRIDRAINYMLEVKYAWPAEWPGFTKQQLRWLRVAEDYHLKLVRLRNAEIVRRGQGSKSAEGLDNLFGDEKGPVRFAGASGKYEAGKIDPKERARLPKDALAIVQQLLLWFPEDTRLLWLLGELYNAEGDINSAAKLLDDCVYIRNYPDTDLRKHRQIVQEARPKGDRLAAEPPGAETTESQFGWLPDKQHLLLVGGLASLVVAALAYLQIREIRRRRTGSKRW